MEVPRWSSSRIESLIKDQRPEVRDQLRCRWLGAACGFRFRFLAFALTRVTHCFMHRTEHYLDLKIRLFTKSVTQVGQ
jgi:hypothetical protein